MTVNTLRTDFAGLDLQRLPSPCYVVDEVAVRQNLEILQQVQNASGARVLAALKAFSMWSLGDLISGYLSGTCCSGLHELRLACEHYRGEHHVFSAAYNESDLREILDLAHTVVFNSISQWHRFQSLINAKKRERQELQFGLRVNPEHSEVTTPLYDPCAPGSRLGIPLSELRQDLLTGISGLHFHTLCEQDFPPLQRTLSVIEQKFGKYFEQMSWVNFGGGHHITRTDYQREALIEAIREFSRRYSVQVYLEPGETIAIGTGVLVAEVLDINHNGGRVQAILNTSATCHMPDTLEMPYRAEIFGADVPGKLAHTYRLGGLTCLAGDVMGDYSFAEPLQVGKRLVFTDMAHYTMVKTTTFNGTRLPAIALWNSERGDIKVLREFGYADFKTRLS